MVRVNSKDDVPAWLSVHSSHIPDFIVQDPWASPVWEISGAEYSTSEHHTASGISIRFPRITRERADKSATSATTLSALAYVWCSLEWCCAHAAARAAVTGELETLFRNSSRVDTSHLTSGTTGTVDVDFLPSMAAIALAKGAPATAKPAPARPAPPSAPTADDIGALPHRVCAGRYCYVCAWRQCSPVLLNGSSRRPHAHVPSACMH